ncbi:MAG: GntR family transcriptional regulator [bacterium]|nr:GntR family transcriptional regulator [Candidatus Colisoma equi]
MERTKYSIIVETLRKEILSGKWTSNSSTFPSERALVRRFGVSRPTVSQALQELRGQGYLQRQQGKGTFLTREAQKISGAIGLIVPGVAYSEFFQPIVTALSGVCTANGYGLSIGSVFSANGEERARQAMTLARDLAEQHVSGVILQPIESIPNAPSVNKQILSAFRAAGIPVVLLDSDIVPPPDRSEYDVIGVNNYDAGRRVAVHMIAAGAKRISFVSMPRPCYSIRHRFAGVQSVLASHGVLLKEMSELDATKVEEVRRFLRKERPDGIICCCDTLAAFLRRTLEKLGKKVPADLLLAGFDDVQHATIMTPALTNARQPCEKIAKEAFRALIERMKDPVLPAREILLNAPLVVRASTRRVMKPVKKGGRKTAKRRTGK